MEWLIAEMPANRLLPLSLRAVRWNLEKIRVRLRDSRSSRCLGSEETHKSRLWKCRLRKMGIAPVQKVPALTASNEKLDDRSREKIALSLAASTASRRRRRSQPRLR